MSPPVSPQQLTEAMRDLSRSGTLVKDRGYRQVWRFEFGNRPYYLKWYPRQGTALKRLMTGNPAMREFARLLAMQNARVPSPRAVAVLKGFRIDQRQGDAIILEGIEPSVQLDRYLADLDLHHAGVVPDRHWLVGQLIELVYQLGRAKLGHDDLHLGNVLLSGGKLFLLDGYAVRPGGLRLRHVMMLGHSASRWASSAELVRGWRLLRASEGVPPAANPVGPRLFRKFMERTRGENAYFGRLAIGGWRGRYVKGIKSPRWWAPASGLRVTAEDWQREWPKLLAGLSADGYEVLKRSGSGAVVAGTVTLGGREVQVVIKRPRRGGLWRKVHAYGRPGKARRSWTKAWKLMIRHFAAEWPLLLMEQRTLGHTLDSVLVVARVPGPTLASLDLARLSAGDRETLFRRLGRTLRRLERAGFCHFDSKSSNWIVLDDPDRGPVPVMVDVDGIRHYRWDGFGIQRLLRSMKDHPQYTREDSLWLCRGYLPYAPIREEAAP